MPHFESIVVDIRDAVTLITLNRPQALNALNGQVLTELIDAFAKFDADDSQRCAVLTGSEKAFVAELRRNVRLQFLRWLRPHHRDA